MNVTISSVILLELTIFAYLIGSIPTGYWFCRYFFNLDITQHGSGNIGATNVARVLGKRWFLIIFFIDALKAYGVLALCALLAPGIDLFGVASIYIFAGAILVGNAYSPFLGFKGGKGVATAVGIFIYLLPFQLNFLFAVLWLILLKLTQKPFIASLVAAVTTVFFYWGLFNGAHTTFLVLICLWLTFRHLPNIIMWCRPTNSTNR